MKNKTNYKEMTDEDLVNRRSQMSDELMSARQKVHSGQFKKTSELGRLRKEIARINTFLRAREIEKEKARKA